MIKCLHQTHITLGKARQIANKVEVEIRKEMNKHDEPHKVDSDSVWVYPAQHL